MCIFSYSYEFGTTVEEEYPNSGLTLVHMYYTKAQSVIELTGETLQATWAFITSIATKQDEAKASFNRGSCLKLFIVIMIYQSTKVGRNECTFSIKTITMLRRGLAISGFPMNRIL